MALDTYECCVNRPSIKTIVLVTGDSDFIPLIQKLRTLNKAVWGFSREAVASKSLIRQLDSFIALKDSNEKVECDPLTQGELQNIIQELCLKREKVDLALVMEAIKRLHSDWKLHNGVRFKTYVLSRLPKNYSIVKSVIIADDVKAIS